MGVRRFLVGLVTVILLLWGPINQSWPLWFGIRVLYLVVIPAATWFLLGWLWRLWQPSESVEDRLKRTLAGVVAGGAFIGAILAAQSRHHFECAQDVGTGHPDPAYASSDCVGGYQRVPGPSTGEFILLAGVGVFALWFGIRE
jgi:hypothetical protein